LESKRLLLKSGTIVDATIIDAPPSTKNEAKARDPEMRQGKKNEREWQFGMKALVGTDRRGIVHTLITTSANISDISKMVHLLHGSKREETRPTGARASAGGAGAPDPLPHQPPAQSWP
jgi:IS5 family transposase